MPEFLRIRNTKTMYEKSDKYRLHQAILDHPDNVGRDAREKYLLNRQLSGWQIEKIRQELDRLNECGGPTKIDR